MENRTENKKKSVYTKWLAERVENLERKISLKELIKEYEEETGKKLSPSAYQKPLKNLKNVKIERHEQLYTIPRRTTRLSIASEYEHNRINRVHSSHNIHFSISYCGEQPVGNGYITHFGRYRTIKRVFFRVSNRITIVAFKRKLNVWVHRPKGTTTQEQLDEARKDAFKAILRFCRDNTLAIEESYLERLISSHHVIENEQINEALKPFFAYPEVQERIGSHICKTSHKGHIEHEGIRRADGTIIQGSSVAKGIEFIMLDFPKIYLQHEQERSLFSEGVREYTAQITKHLIAINGINANLGKQTELFGKIERALTRFIDKQEGIK